MKSIGRRQFIQGVAGMAGAAALGSRIPAAPAAARPNIIFILTDDQRHEAIGAAKSWPWLKTPNIDRLVSEGTHFANGFCTTSLCSPSRASFLTGAYANHHGVIVNSSGDFKPQEFPHFGQTLGDAGYETAFIGKWHMATHNRPRPGFDHWVSFRGQGSYWNLMLNIDGNPRLSNKYITDELTDRATAFIQKKRKKPFLLYLSHKAMHDDNRFHMKDTNPPKYNYKRHVWFEPAPRHTDLYKDVDIPTFDDPDDRLDLKPEWVRRTALWRRHGEPAMPLWSHTKDYLRTLAAVDDSVGRVMEILDKTGQMDNTLIVYAGDNGLALGEHGLLHKEHPYEMTMRIPIIARLPGVFPAGKRCDDLALNIDLFPTLCDVAGVTPPDTVQGRSWVPVADGRRPGRERFFYEVYSQKRYRENWSAETCPTAFVLRGNDWKYTTYPEDTDYVDELYNIREDPKELVNLALAPEHAETLASMKQDLELEMKSIDYRPPQPMG